MNISTSIPRIAISAGEPAGIGPDLCVLLAATPFNCQPIIFADPDLLLHRANQLGVSINFETVDYETSAAIPKPGQLIVHPIQTAALTQTGELNSANANYVLQALTAATEACLTNHCQALCTGPIHKGIINDAGIPFSGHTEYLGGLCAGKPVMMLASPTMRVALLTTHIPLREVADSITQQRILDVLHIVDQDLRIRFAIDKPRIMVCGLNPHAGENGHMGTEDIEIIEPALQQLRQQGMHLIGPVPADTAFTPHMLEQCDAVLAMFHDQGLPPLKQTGFGQAVNITLGLSIIRTSVDHGTALDLAGSGNIDSGSFIQAIQQACELAISAKT